MHTLRVQDGDLVLGAGGYALIRGGHKIAQDLRFALTEPFGTDRFHPRWGSILGDYIGLAMDAELPFHVEGEVNRVVGNYMRAQGQEVARDLLDARATRFRDDGVIRTIGQVVTRSRADRLDVSVTIATLAGEQVNVQVSP